MNYNEKAFERLKTTSKSEAPFISIYLPTHRAGASKEDFIRYKNMLSQAKYQLMEYTDMDGKTAKKYLSKAYDLLADDYFWMHLSDGLCLFIADNRFEYYRMPIDFEKRIFIGQRFYLTPTIPVLNDPVNYFILALSQNKVELFEARQHSITPIIIDDLIPKNLDVAIGEEAPEKQIHSHSAASGQAIYHGHGAGKDNKHNHLEQFFRQVDKGLMNLLHDEDKPLLLAGVDYYMPIYKSISSYQNIVENHISGNVENDDPVLLHEKSWQIMQSFYANKIKAEQQRFETSIHQQKASYSLHHIVAAAINGQVDTLFYDKDSNFFWGTYDPQTNTVESYPERKEGAVCLINLAVQRTLANGGRVLPMSVERLPRMESPLNAIYRYTLTESGTTS